MTTQALRRLLGQISALLVSMLLWSLIILAIHIVWLAI